MSVILPSLYFTNCHHLTLQSGPLTMTINEPWIKTRASEILTWNILYFLSIESDQSFDCHIPCNVQVHSLCVRKCLVVHVFHHLLGLMVYITNFNNCHSLHFVDRTSCNDSWWMTNVMHKLSSMCLFLFTTLYMFRAHRAHHQERQIVSIQPLVTVILCWWPRCVQVGHRMTVTRDCIETICLSWWWALCARNM